MVSAEFLEYAKRLPEIYRDILGTFYDIVPTRRKGWGLALPTIYERLREKHPEGKFHGKYSIGDLKDAVGQLQSQGFVELRHDTFVHPTDTGELLLEALTGKQPMAYRVPDLPAPPALS